MLSLYAAQTGVTSTPVVGACMVSKKESTADAPLNITTLGVDEGKLGKEPPLQSPYTTTVKV